MPLEMTHRETTGDNNQAAAAGDGNLSDPRVATALYWAVCRIERTMYMRGRAPARCCGRLHAQRRSRLCSLNDLPTRQQLASLAGAGPQQRNEGSSWSSLLDTVCPETGKELKFGIALDRPASWEPRAGQERMADGVVDQRHLQLLTYTGHPLAWRHMGGSR